MQTGFETDCPKTEHVKEGFCGIIVAAGSGTRFKGELPKQLYNLNGIPVFLHSVNAMVQHPQCIQCILVIDESFREQFEAHLSNMPEQLRDKINMVEGGSERAISVSNGIRLIDQEQASSILIHDAARPGLTAEVIDSLLTALEAHDGAAPALPVSDSLKRMDGDSVSSVSRDNLYRIQTPQAFRKACLLDMYTEDIVAATDDFTLAEAKDLSLTLVSGSDALGKITYQEDLMVMEKLLSVAQPVFRTGLGYDVHAFEDGDGVILCGTFIPHGGKLKGHSDADVAWHALTDAILGALADGDIGDHFPPSDPQWKGAPSSVFLEFAANRVRERGGEITNVDVTLICEAPKVKPHRDVMRKKTAEILGISVSDVAVKATTTERLGFTGREEGIAAQAICSIRLPSHSTAD
ncbi:bifunctional 2-C-methyl-D-erythritol 4-phosphate cytidylyltransferase/2-C-methyl-D-erythritol 2,4-cyclodiphosphate synthase [Ponticaulis sp.]|uniref:bifunctional 2-C-methyl-D-erythritol 4-phosphate cytidylyltransferase/2-C-methyl-D-erythritol 2,4-cyclodiphosphate synthase n=1 Tax=Ponticaulis sp. TaxID=2020902 RepID=UPI000C504945|nr:bifunctional 2-C-methyl-D-erythritol 4-phosphate cytidylyltransferase/2-C-methyl-D-erythritol 2,4-cyclodiphosphate synthase [Ponticaulis sp.]MAJ08258.1 bifunctional 2-C-methyl-D-erythritol 4-phosphate cytidylyltransferase/2-C-methyl-D-erythritol 2,4-cyclodiphosphate synthase [Ponticaulis sp.]HBH89019.1 bifunctional 2-C-methyl-D-erythritol 4-phosphate cytidylyltransferase/2-C-methyl-D-erythritol 2,4-cyclodiphosphate synthase [Hyphomonadaceae bacterium]HBJ92392.1 bifunctional 2-C-methyl-D-eryth|tara:strand:- start:9614 stop:10837 length:1224 start_codon:yes stop_codon:yes gene_type:complete